VEEPLIVRRSRWTNLVHLAMHVNALGALPAVPQVFVLTAADGALRSAGRWAID
jgi:hypothetical protein